MFSDLDIGLNTVTASAPGFTAGSISVQITGPSACCGQGEDVHRTLTLAP